MKKIIITGASKGIGKASAELLASQGHKVHIIARSKEKLSEMASENENISFSVGDVIDHGSIKAALELGMEKMGGLDVVLNNAGLGYFDPLEGGSIEHWHHMVDVNVKGALSVMHICIPHLIKSTGLIINVASVAAHNVFPNSGVYCSTKHALLALSESIRIELGDRIRVSTISPGAVNTEFIHQTTNEGLLDNLRPHFKAGLDPSDIAEQIAMVVNAKESVMISEVIVRPSKTS